MQARNIAEDESPILLSLDAGLRLSGMTERAYRQFIAEGKIATVRCGPRLVKVTREAIRKCIRELENGS
jgi:hypothetical protein